MSVAMLPVIHTPKPKPRKRPRYSGDLLPVACALARHGATDVEIAAEIGVVESVIYVWKNKHPEFAEALKLGKKSYDDRVEMSLAKRAMGYTQKKVKVHFDKDKERFHAFEYEEDVAPDTTAMIFWLKNRQPLQWRDKIDIDAAMSHQHELTADGEPVSKRDLAIAMINVLNDAKREHTDEGMINVTPNEANDAERPSNGPEAAQEPVRPISAPEGGQHEPEAVPVEHSAESRPDTRKSVEGRPVRRRLRRGT